VLRIFVLISLFAAFVKYGKDYLQLYAVKMWGLHFFILLGFFVAIINAEFYSVYALFTLVLSIVVVYGFSRDYGSGLLSYYHSFVAIFSIISFAYYFIYPDIGRYTYWQDGVIFQSPRMQGIAGHPNTLGFMIGTALLISISFGLRFFKTYYGAITTLLLFCALLMTNSRTNLISVIFVAMLYISFKVKHQFYFLLVSLLSLSISSAFVLILPDELNAIFRIFSRTGDIQEILSFTGRSDIWYVVIEMFYQNPILGWGYAKSSDILGLSSESVGFVVGQAHNLYLQLLLSLGLVGGGAFLIWFFHLAFLAYKKQKYGQMAILIYFYIVGFTETIILNTIANNAFLVFCLIMVGDFSDE
jgi:O-antigen ligase